MATKADFNALDWETIANAPAFAGLIVATAQKGGTIRESLAMGKAYIAAREAHRNHDVIGEIAAQAPQIDPRSYPSLEQMRSEGLAKIGEAVTLLEPSASAEELEAFKAFVMDVGRRAAEADKSGGVLGIGGERVSDAERAAIGEIATVLGTEPPALEG